VCAHKQPSNVEKTNLSTHVALGVKHDLINATAVNLAMTITTKLHQTTKTFLDKRHGNDNKKKTTPNLTNAW
jgi:hypothetical protein